MIEGASRLRGEGLVVGYGGDPVLDGADLAVLEGELTVIVGPNACGKSTLLRALARLHAVDRGRVVLGEEQDVATLDPRRLAREVTLFSQSRPAPQGLAVREVVAFGRHPHRGRFAGLSAEDRRVIEQAMDLTGVRAMAERSVGELPGGEMQRVWLATCLAQDTGVVLLDEPTNHLDLRYQIETLDLVRDLADQRGVAVGIVLHDLDHAARVADEVLLLHAGRIHAAGHPVDVLTSENVSEVYEIPVEVTLDARTGRLRIDPLGRHAPPRVATTSPIREDHP
jgi:iron complex transport system ATP-binding protein